MNIQATKFTVSNVLLLPTFVFKSGNDEVEPVGFGAPAIGDVFERDEVGACVDCADALTRVATRQVSLNNNDPASGDRHERQSHRRKVVQQHPEERRADMKCKRITSFSQ